MSDNFGEMIAHVLSSLDAHAAGEGKCFAPNHKYCRLPKMVRAHLASVGPPCQPWSQQRIKAGETLNTGSPDKHPDAHILLDEVPRFLSARNPYGALIAEVPSILASDAVSGDSCSY